MGRKLGAGTAAILRRCHHRSANKSPHRLLLATMRWREGAREGRMEGRGGRGGGVGIFDDVPPSTSRHRSRSNGMIAIQVVPTARSMLAYHVQRCSLLVSSCRSSAAREARKAGSRERIVVIERIIFFWACGYIDLVPQKIWLALIHVQVCFEPVESRIGFKV